MTLKDEHHAYSLVAKRILRSKLTSNTDTLSQYRRDIVNAHNRYIEYVVDKYEQASVKNREIYGSSVEKLIAKTSSCFTRLKATYEFTDNIFAFLEVERLVDREIFELVLTESDIEDSSENSDYEDTMVQTKEEFLVYASKLLPDFDGSFANLQSFCDGLSLVNLSVGTHGEAAVELVKTKLKNDSRMYISNEATLQAIIATLKDKIKPDSTAVVTSKLMGVSQAKKKVNEYVKEVETLTASLKRAYIAEGVPLPLADQYATRSAVEAMQKNAASDKVRLLMEAGKFVDLNEAVDKFVKANNDEATGTASINYVNKRYGVNNQRGRRGNHRNYRGSNGYYYNNNGNSNRNYQNGNNWRSNNNNNNRPRGNNRGRNNGRVRVANVEENNSQGNGQAPQQTRLRDA